MCLPQNQSPIMLEQNFEVPMLKSTSPLFALHNKGGTRGPTEVICLRTRRETVEPTLKYKMFILSSPTVI